MSARIAPPPLGLFDGPSLLDAFRSGSQLLASRSGQVNALNVFPVPDGDTGTNMTATMRAAVQAAGEADAASASAVAERLAFGALMGARGNSGVILSQVLRGFARPIAGRDAIDGRDVAAGLIAARDTAYKAVMKPVEGTMLSVVRLAAEAADRTARRTPSLQSVIDAALEAGKAALADTPNQLDLLRQAGVVDAGGQGFLYILEGIALYARGDPVGDDHGTSAASAPPVLDVDERFRARIDEMHGEHAYGYCTNFMIFGSGIAFDRVREELAAMGDSAVIVGDDRIVKVHIHTPNPGSVLEVALRSGELGQIKIDNMNDQVDHVTSPQAEPLPTPPLPPIGGQSILAVAAGDGLADALTAMGSTSIVRGGQSMNPSIEELLDAVDAAPTTDVLLLPNNPNILMAANQIPTLTEKRVRVVATRSVPQGLAALSAFNAADDLDENAESMSAAAGHVRTVEIARADKAVCIDGLCVRQGDAIGLVDDLLFAGGLDELAVTLGALSGAGAASAELITIFPGEGVTLSHRDPLSIAISERFPDATLEIHAGGQPHYRYIVSVE